MTRVNLNRVISMIVKTVIFSVSLKNIYLNDNLMFVQVVSLALINRLYFLMGNFNYYYSTLFII